MFHIHQLPLDEPVFIEGAYLVSECLEVGSLGMVDKGKGSTLVALVQAFGDNLPCFFFTLGSLRIRQPGGPCQFTRPNVTIALEHLIEKFPIMKNYNVNLELAKFNFMVSQKDPKCIRIIIYYALFPNSAPHPLCFAC